MVRPALIAFALLSAAACTPSGPTPTPSPSPTPTPSPTPAGRVFTAADFTRSGGCGDVFAWASSTDDTIGVTVQWDLAASTAWEQEGYDASTALPAVAVQVFLVHGSMLSQSYCTDILMPGVGSDGQAPAVAGMVEIVVTPDAGGFKPSSHANTTLKDIVFDIAQGAATEQWRIDLLELQNLSVGWFAG